MSACLNKSVKNKKAVRQASQGEAQYGDRFKKKRLSLVWWLTGAGEIYNRNLQ